MAKKQKKQQKNEGHTFKPKVLTTLYKKLSLSIYRVK